MEAEFQSSQSPKLSKGTVPGEMVEEGRIWEWMREGDDAHPESFVWGYKNGCSLMRRQLLIHQTLSTCAVFTLFSIRRVRSTIDPSTTVMVLVSARSWIRRLWVDIHQVSAKP